VVIPTADGWFHSRLPFKISYLPRGDVVLGADWIAICQPQFCHGGILWPLQSVVAHLPTGHSWVPVPNTLKFILTYKFATNNSFKVYQITAHKIQVYDESERPVEPRLLPQLPGGQSQKRSRLARGLHGP
jgi:hypothetical protein